SASQFKNAEPVFAFGMGRSGFELKLASATKVVVLDLIPPLERTAYTPLPFGILRRCRADNRVETLLLADGRTQPVESYPWQQQDADKRRDDSRRGRRECLRPQSRSGRLLR